MNSKNGFLDYVGLPLSKYLKSAESRIKEVLRGMILIMKETDCVFYIGRLTKQRQHFQQ